MIVVDASARVSSLADIEDSLRGTRIEIGPRVTIDAFVKIKPAGGSGDVIIGADSTINSGCVFYTGNGITIGRDVAIAANCTFAPVNHAFQNRGVPIVRQGFNPSKGGISVGDDVWIGANCVLLDGAVVGQGCVVAAGSIVRGTLEPYGIYGGQPLRRLGERA
jgi:virginiamycin A acetyltransferase